jgi:hypothetical protein
LVATSDVSGWAAIVRANDVASSSSAPSAWTLAARPQSTAVRASIQSAV